MHTYYLTIVAGWWGETLNGTLPLEQIPVWSLVEQTIEIGPGWGSVSSRSVASSMTLHQAQRRLAEMTEGCPT